MWLPTVACARPPEPWTYLIYWEGEEKKIAWKLLKESVWYTPCTSDSIVCMCRSSQAHPLGDTGPYATDMADFSLEATACQLRHYRDVQLPGMTGKVPPLKELTHPSKLNKRSFHSVPVMPRYNVVVMWQEIITLILVLIHITSKFKKWYPTCMYVLLRESRCSVLICRTHRWAGPFVVYHNN